MNIAWIVYILQINKKSMKVFFHFCKNTLDSKNIKSWLWMCECSMNVVRTKNWDSNMCRVVQWCLSNSFPIVTYLSFHFMYFLFLVQRPLFFTTSEYKKILWFKIYFFLSFVAFRVHQYYSHLLCESVFFVVVLLFCFVLYFTLHI